MKSKLFTQYRSISPLIFLSLLTIIAFVKGTGATDGTRYNFIINYKHYLAFIALFCNYYLFFFKRRYYKGFVILTFFLAVFNFINFTVYETAIIIGLRFQPYIIFIILLTYFFNFEKTNDLIFNLIGYSSEDRAKKLEEYESKKVEEFKEKFKNYSSETLEKIIKENRLVIEAIAASKQILETRNA